MEGDRGLDGRPEFLTAGSERRLTDRVSGPRRIRLTVALALVLGLVVGGYGGYAWLAPVLGRDGGVHLDAYVRGPRALRLPYPPYRLPLELRNAEDTTVTVRRARLDVGGYEVLLGPSRPRTIRPGETETFVYGIRPDCGHPPSKETPVLRLRLRTVSGDVHDITVHPAVARREIRAGYAILCSREPPRPVVRAFRVGSRARSGHGLKVRVELTAEASGGQSVQPRFRLLRVDTQAPRGVSLTVTGGVSSSHQPPLPATITVRMEVTNCTAVPHSPANALALRVAFTSPAGPYFVYAHTGPGFATAVRRAVSRSCGNG